MTVKSKMFSRREVLAALGSALVFPIATSRAAEAGPKAKAAHSHRMLSCNILLDLPEQKELGHGWDQVRKDVCIDVIRSQDADIISLQEVGRGQNRDFEKAFLDFRAFGYPDPYVDTRPKRFKQIKNVILYSTKRYELVSGGIYWLSKTPHIAGSMWPESRIPREVTWLRLKDRPTGTEFRVLNTHWETNEQIRPAEAQIIAAETGQYEPDFPQLLMGDFNSITGSPEHKILAAADWNDSYTAIHGDVSEDTHHGFMLDERFQNDRRIDCIFTRGTVTPKSAEVIKDRRNGHYPSDHYFVSADVIIQGGE